MNKLKWLLSKTRLIIAVTFVIFLTGCAASGLGVENYMRPPAPAGDSARIQQLLTETLGSEYTLRYPRSGEYRSAVVLEDIDDDEAQEAIVFYRLSTESTGSHMIVLDCTAKGDWVVAGENIGGGEIDRVLFGDINGDGFKEVITGWSGVSDGRMINVHGLSESVLYSVEIISGETDSYPADQYSEMAVGDFDGDLRDEIMTVYRNSAAGSAIARILRLGHGVDGSSQLRTAGSIDTDGSVYQYINAQAGYTAFGQYCLIIDGCKGSGHYVTEIVYWDAESDMLASPADSSGNLISTIFDRSLDTISQDINGDGMIEIPTDELLPGYSQRSQAPMYLTSWYNVNAGEAQLAMQALMRFDQGYYFRYPVGWDGKVTVRVDSFSNTMYFYQVDAEDPFSNEIFRIKIFTLDEWEDRRETLAEAFLGDDAQDGEPDYDMLAVTNYYVYASLRIQPVESTMPGDEVIKENFQLIS